MLQHKFAVGEWADEVYKMNILANIDSSIMKEITSITWFGNGATAFDRVWEIFDDLFLENKELVRRKLEVRKWKMNETIEEYGTGFLPMMVNRRDPRLDSIVKIL